MFSVGGMWRGAGDDRSTAELSGVVTEEGTDRRLPVEGTLSVRLGRVVHTELHLRFGDGRITAARDVDLAPTSLPRLLGQTQQFLGQMLHQVATPAGSRCPARWTGATWRPRTSTSRSTSSACCGWRSAWSADRRPRTISVG